MKKAPAKDKPTTDEAMAALMLDRQERIERFGKALEELSKKERVRLKVAGFDLVEGRLIPVIKLEAMD